MTCIHDKSYSPTQLLSNPPKIPWICRRCGERGVDTKPYIHNDYYETIEKFKEKK